MAREFGKTAHYLSVPECLLFFKWYQTAKPGDVYTYFTGQTLTDPQHIWALKNLVWDHATKGRLYLYQKKLGIDKYQYMCQIPRWTMKKLIPFDYGFDTKRRSVKKPENDNGISEEYVKV